VAKPLELQCSKYRVSGASIGHGRHGAVFRCTLEPVSDDVIEALGNAVRCEDVIRLVFPKQPLLLERIQIKRVEPGRIRIAGHIVNPD